MFRYLTSQRRLVQVHIHCNAHNQINKDGIFTFLATFIHNCIFDVAS